MPKFNLKHIFLIPTLFLVLIVGFILNNHMNSVQRQVNREYDRIINSLQRSIKVIISLDYNISQLYKQNQGSFYNHNFEIKKDSGLCVIRPSENLDAVMAEQDISVAEGRLDYSIAGKKDLCDPSSEVYEIASKKVSLAPVISFIHDYESYLHGIYFISKYNYIISSPKEIAENLSQKTLDVIYSRPYWKNSMKNDSEKYITFTPPYTDAFFDGLEVLTFSTPIYYKGIFKGVLVIDLSVEKLLRSSNEISQHIQLLNSDEYKRFEQYRFMQPVNLDFTDFTYFLYYKTSIKEELKGFLVHDSNSLILTLVMYILSLLSMFYYQSRVSQKYYRDLAKQDPMTGLYNRRGFEMSLQDRVVKKYVGFAIYDIDDFKQINDVFGHDVGDEAIKYVARMLNKSVRDSDIVSRFGGEEFVICINAESRNSLESVCERVRKSIQDSSGKVVKGGFTVSGGVTVIDSHQEFSFEHVIKKADALLYKAKQDGKNRVYFS
ncbi:GGDEF domain protein [Aliivibrio fischeri ES114]|uniref:diguanylate cyclase n=3 Tax=Aliivibrio fischeri TaxID=668 RepID=Q5E4B2_ALIF1|nr:diguanylate cyclase [Aliivibrio fischeri]AAW86134.1 GGDEF domain protein [Aliivibrio fischeri ES114]KLU79575.1 diguanylate cyclase [Aliivibrio fischeri]MCE7577019.1 diguanylate cyclase [Aliivibrio fischeri]MCE7588859.1 diguanylate cyclase [Aliivibrio fischeri]MUK43607.1 diguanylate cyclase [Aliivibrio fischeri]